MDNVQRIYRRTEKNLIPRRPCPDCGTPVRAVWREHPGFSADINPQGDAIWRCLGEQCFTGRVGF
ncbi:hypothetical protein [Streptomyces sp. AC555_RSS877]|uniref:hypothetical protein n=1 Tax=Streptomyces sp. AC555_RSS877 TaxID=2823688 RepID=UPI001C2549AB|nr:hypothetical protein [Streptomyces sp. AC555_RSS877]